ncbi:MAG: SHOCT domain-containing protein [Dehalococcoidia bacterium]|nr:SHOCT domain-containing protein [Dehalococcoidia bacterium]
MNRNLKTALIIGGVVLLALVALPLLGWGYGWQGGGWGMMGPGMMGSVGGAWWMVIPMLLIPVLVIWAIVALTRGVSWSGDHGASGHGESALEVLRKRYARGDINKQEFEEKRRDLE